MERAVRILWTWAVEKGPATLTATVLSVPPSAALQDSVRITSLLDEATQRQSDRDMKISEMNIMYTDDFWKSPVELGP